MTDPDPINPIPVGIDDGYAYTKIALSGDRFYAIPSCARLGASGITWIQQAQQRVFEYAADGAIYSVGEVDGAPTQFEGYPESGLNRAIVQHALQQAGISGQSVHAVSGLPVSAFYQRSGELRTDTISRKRKSLQQAVHPLADKLPTGISFHEVIPEALAA